MRNFELSLSCYSFSYVSICRLLMLPTINVTLYDIISRIVYSCIVKENKLFSENILYKVEKIIINISRKCRKQTDNIRI